MNSLTALTSDDITALDDRKELIGGKMGTFHDIFVQVAATLISAAILAWATRFLKAKRPLLLNWVWRTLRVVLFFALFGLLLFWNASNFDRTEVVAISLFLSIALVFEAFLNWQAIYQHSRTFLRVVFNVSIVYLLLNTTAEEFDHTEILTILQFLILNLIFELVRAKGKTKEIDEIRYEINCRVNRQRLKALFALNDISIANVNRIFSRSYLHVAVFLRSELVGFVSLIWSGDGPAEVDYLLVDPNVTDIATESLRLMEIEAQEVGIRELQISNKVIRSNADLEDRLSNSGYFPESCLVKHFSENQSEAASEI